MLDFRRMRVLLEVAERGSMTAAADALGLTPSAVSQQVITLEREAGVALVERGPRSVVLTDAGRALARHARTVSDRLTLAETELRDRAGLDGGRLRIGCFRTAGETLLAEAIACYHRAHPSVELTLAAGEPEDQVPALQRRELDLVLGFEYDTLPLEPDPAVERVPLLAEELCVILPPAHAAAAAPTVALPALAGDAWIASRWTTRDFTANVCRAAGFEPAIAFETDDYHVAQALVASGVGVAFLPAMSERTMRPDVVLRRVRPDPPGRRIFAACRAGDAALPAIAAMIAILSAPA
jgi:DNA-binding transcriptional LysR family regulator